MNFDEKFEEFAYLLQSNNMQASLKQCEDLFLSLHERVRDRIESEQEEEVPTVKSLIDDW